MSADKRDLANLRAYLAHDGPGLLNVLRLHALVLSRQHADVAPSTDAMVRAVGELEVRFDRLAAYLADARHDPTGQCALGEVCEALDLTCEHGETTVPLNVQAATRVVRELVDNARTHGSGPVQVFGMRGGRGGIVVRDAGEGPAHWEAMTRLLVTDADGHAGIGLAWVRRLVEATGGMLHGARCDEGFAVEVSWG